MALKNNELNLLIEYPLVLSLTLGYDLYLAIIHEHWRRGHVRCNCCQIGIGIIISRLLTIEILLPPGSWSSSVPMHMPL